VVLSVLLNGHLAADERPNIILFMTDDQSPFVWDYPDFDSAKPFGFNGERSVYTPEIDRIASEGMIFDRAYVSSSVCAPSRYTVLSGRYAGRSTGAVFMQQHPAGSLTRVENNTELEYDRPNLAKVLNANGYRTGFVGKSHLIEHNAVQQPELWDSNYGLKAYDEEDDPREREVAERMRHNHDHWRRSIGRQGFDYVDGVYAANLSELYNEKSNVHNVEWTTRAALNFIESSGDIPFFLYYATTVPHGPSPWVEAVRPVGDGISGLAGALQSRISKYAQELDRIIRRIDRSAANGDGWLSKSGLNQQWIYLTQFWQRALLPRLRRAGYYPHGLHADPHMSGQGYVDHAFPFMPRRQEILREAIENGVDPRDAWLTWIDYSIGAIRKKLVEQDKWDNTLIIITSDHGAWRHGKTTLYEGGLRVPLAIRWPKKIAGGSRYADLVQNIDFAPTILEAAGINLPAEMEADGVSLMEVFEGSKNPIHEYLFAELGYSRAVITKSWKYIAIRYTDAVLQSLEGGEKFPGFEGRTLEAPYLTRNAHLGHYAALHNKHYFEVDQLFNITDDPKEEQNIISQRPDKVRQMRGYLADKLSAFPNRPFGEFTEN
jgi:arylsulfatase A-like enzyme